MKVLIENCLVPLSLFLHRSIYDNCALMVNQTEESRWKQLSVEYMSEESDDKSDSQVVVVDQPEWRSQHK